MEYSNTRRSLRNQFARLIWLMIVLSFTCLAGAPANGQGQMRQGQTAGAPTSKQDPHDLSGIWFTIPRAGHASLESAADVQQPVDDEVRPPMTAWASERYKNNIPHGGPRAIAGKENDPVLRCYPDGFPKILEVPQPFEIIQIPGRVLVNYEMHGLRRQIWTDGRSLPKDPEPSFMGYSVGRWEGDTFVVDTIGFNDITWLDFDGSPHSEQLHVTERYRRVDHDTLEIAIELSDPKAYTKPWTNKPVTFILKPHWELMEHFCIVDEENVYEKNIMIPAGGASLPPVQKKP